MSASDETILFVDDEAHLRLAAEQSLMLADMKVACFAEPEKALSRIARDFMGILVTDIRLPGMDGLTLMARALEIDPAFPVILITGHGDVELAVRSMRDGAYDFLEKPFAPQRLVDAARRALEKRRLTLENRVLLREVGERDTVEARLTGRSPAIIAFRKQVRAIAETDADVLIQGETGSGKEVTARALHRASARAKGPFVQINCAALPADLIESELFGHEAGAFPGATRARFGKFEHARGGSILLDEIDSLPLPLQGKLLHAVSDRTVTRLGSNDATPLDVRFFAASKAELTEEVVAGRFRADLLYRLNVVTLRQPNLAERREDIPRLFAQLVQEAALRYQRAAPDIPGAILTALATRDWPGNVRELRNVADRFALGLALDLGPQGKLGKVEEEGDPTASAVLADTVAAYERKVIAAALAAHGGSLKTTYLALGLSRKALYEKMQKHSLSRDDYVE